MVGIIERLEQIVRERGRLPRCELTEYLTMCFSYYDEKDPTIIGMIKRACEDKGISLECETARCFITYECPRKSARQRW